MDERTTNHAIHRLVDRLLRGRPVDALHDWSCSQSLVVLSVTGISTGVRRHTRLAISPEQQCFEDVVELLKPRLGECV